jgi:hypothetical protein
LSATEISEADVFFELLRRQHRLHRLDKDLGIEFLILFVPGGRIRGAVAHGRSAEIPLLFGSTSHAFLDALRLHRPRVLEAALAADRSGDDLCVKGVLSLALGTEPPDLVVRAG